MKKKIFSIPKNKKCSCGKKITDHHFECNDCYRLRKKTNKLKLKAMEKIKNFNFTTQR